MIRLAAHELAPGGVETVVLVLDGPLPAPPLEMLPNLAPLLVGDEETGAWVTWTFTPLMTPQDPVAFAIAAVRRDLGAWACRWSGGPVDLTEGLEST